MEEMVLSGAKGKLFEALQGQEGLAVRELEEETGLRQGTIAQTLSRHPELFERGPRGWGLTPRAIEISEERGEEGVSIIGGVVPVEERKVRLSEIIRWPLPSETQVTPRHRMEAIDLLNKMEQIYREGEPVREIKATFIFVLPDGRRVEPKALALLPGEEAKETLEMERGENGS